VHGDAMNLPGGGTHQLSAVEDEPPMEAGRGGDLSVGTLQQGKIGEHR
jgi:hypothetical protein